MQKALGYSRSEDLSNLIFICDIRHAIVSAPISQGKAPKWHDGIHLTNKEKKHLNHCATKGKVTHNDFDDTLR